MLHPLAIACVLAGCASSAFAGGGFLYPPVMKIVSEAEAGNGPLQGLIGRILRPRAEAPPIDSEPFDTSDPTTEVYLPPLPPPPPVTAPTRAARTVTVPFPHLRPRSIATASVAGSTTATTQAMTLPSAGVSLETTASIAPEPPEPPSPPAAATAATTATSAPPAIVAEAPPPAPLPEVAEETQGDDLLGDVTTYFAPQSHEMDPESLAPAVVDPALRAKSEPPAMPPDMNVSTIGEPYQLIRTLQSVQDRIAQGSTSAIAAQRALRAEIDRQFAIAEPAVWQDRRNAEAAVTYVLSGGLPAVLKRLAELDPKPAIDMHLVTGVLAYAEGHEPEAASDLAAVNPLELPASMGAQMALAQSALAVRSDPEKAMRLLSIARLLAPGTLVEEAAIRRQLFVANQLKADDMVETLARQYLDRFRHSVYAGNFRVRFASAMSRMELNSEESFARLDDMLASVEPQARCQLYLTVALASAIKSRFVAARLAAERAATLSAPASPEEAQSRLYHAAALAADPKGFETAVGDFNGIDRRLLRVSDQGLYDVVATTLEGIRSGTLRESMPAAAALPPEDPANTVLSALATRAGDAVKAVDELLEVAAR